jgi:hypothetical protein
LLIGWGSVRLDRLDLDRIREWVESGGLIRLVQRGGRVHVRLVRPRQPSETQLRARRELAEASREASRLTEEEVARLAGGEVVEVGGSKMVKLPDGRVVGKQAAYVFYRLRRRGLQL